MRRTKRTQQDDRVSLGNKPRMVPVRSLEVEGYTCNEFPEGYDRFLLDIPDTTVEQYEAAFKSLTKAQRAELFTIREAPILKTLCEEFRYQMTLQYSRAGSKLVKSTKTFFDAFETDYEACWFSNQTWTYLGPKRTLWLTGSVLRYIQKWCPEFLAVHRRNRFRLGHLPETWCRLSIKGKQTWDGFNATLAQALEFQFVKEYHAVAGEPFSRIKKVVHAFNEFSNKAVIKELFDAEEYRDEDDLDLEMGLDYCVTALKSPMDDSLIDELNADLEGPQGSKKSKKRKSRTKKVAQLRKAGEDHESLSVQAVEESAVVDQPAFHPRTSSTSSSGCCVWRSEIPSITLSVKNTFIHFDGPYSRPRSATSC